MMDPNQCYSHEENNFFVWIYYQLISNILGQERGQNIIGWITELSRPGLGIKT